MADIDNVKEITDSLYSSFVARDFFAKVLPGGVVFSALIFSIFYGNPDFEQLQKIPSFLWLFVYGYCWILGFFVQGFGERINVVRASPKNVSNSEYHEGVSVFFVSTRNHADRLQRERFVVIKEATGNMAVAISIGLLIVLQQLYVPQWRVGLFGMLAILCA
ncbi:hypothetical protein [Methylomonas sp. ZR1]|uniref:hypothetical protein n=1 Tax=Methylomonas sp. ZR1 TaxID=1797072 RepID=UPI00149199EB|nr:hypothetical protein [Methylomonas sp. ZR1]NOV29603.1 hypothetical protein [Methylomonas sp. ZR1]